MGRVITESFEGAHFYRFGNVLGTLPSPFGGSSVNISTTQIIDGLRTMYIDGYDHRATIPIPAQTEYFIGFFFISPNPALVFNGFGQSGTTGNHKLTQWISAGAQLGYVRINPLTQKLETYVGTGNGVLVASSSQTQVITAGTIYHVQVHVDCTAGLIETKLDDVLIMSVNVAIGAATIDRFDMWGGGNSAADNNLDAYQIFDDIVINDAVPSLCTDTDTWPGVLRFQVQLIAGAGTYSQFTPVPVQPNYLNVDEVPHDSDTSYNYALSSGLKDSFPVSPNGLNALGVTYKAWFQEVIAKKTSGTFKIKLGVRRAGVDYIEATGHDLGVAYDVYDSYRCEDPSTLGSWTSAALDATEIIYQSD